MDELLETFTTSLSTKKDTYNHSAYYKTQGRSTFTQEKRRLDLLNAQKEKRDSQVNASRGILDLIKEADLEEKSEKKPKLAYKPKVFVPGFHKKKPFYADTLMLSEWMINVPEDLQNNWLILACPKGTRVLVVAFQGRTRAYSKHGHFYKEFRSTLPGGLKSNIKLEQFCMLDCVLNDKLGMLFVLDVLAWGNLSMTDCDLQFREYWLKSKFEESPHLGTISKANSYCIQPVQKNECSKESISALMSQWPVYPDNNPPVDGLLFYHKEGHYIRGYTPLVVWLFPFMVNELLGSDLTVHQKYMEQRPKDYVNQNKYIEIFEKNIIENTKKKEMYTSRRVRSFSSTSSSSSSLDSSFASNQSDHTHVVFCASKAKRKAKEVEDVDFPKVGKASDFEQNEMPGKNMEVANSSTDSAVCFMDDSNAEISNVDCDISNN